MNRKFAFALFVSGVSLVGWGFCMGRYETFPFLIVQSIKLQIFPFKQKEHQVIPNDWGWKSNVSHFRELAYAPQIVMLGDSITAGAEWHELFPEAKIVNRGIGGDTTAGMLARVEEISQKNPRMVFLLAGINDLDMGMSPDAVFNSYRKLIDLLDDADTDVIVQSTLLPGRNVEEEQRMQVDALNQKLRKYCLSERILFVDLNETLAQEGALASEYTFDGIHLNGTGYFAWSEAIAELVVQAGR